MIFKQTSFHIVSPVCVDRSAACAGRPGVAVRVKCAACRCGHAMA
jgi:hypothetical protein